MQQSLEKHVVEVMEYERGWGSRLDAVEYFDTETAAMDYCIDFNSDNTSENVPDWYMVANYIGKRNFPQFN